MAGRGNPANLTNAGKGRLPGSVNKTTKLAKQAIADAAEKLGGTDRLVTWAQEAPENERVFWGTIYPKLLPLQIDAKVAMTNGEQVDRARERALASLAR